MKLPLLLMLLIGTAAQTAVSQEVTLEELQNDQALLKAEITSLKAKVISLEDSLIRVENSIHAILEKKKETVVKLAPNELITVQDVEIRSSPHTTSPTVLTLEKNSRLLKIDKIGAYFLVCFEGTCGYVLTKHVQGPQQDLSAENSTS